MGRPGPPVGFYGVGNHSKRFRVAEHGGDLWRQPREASLHQLNFHRLVVQIVTNCCRAPIGYRGNPGKWWFNEPYIFRHGLRNSAVVR